MGKMVQHRHHLQPVGLSSGDAKEHSGQQRLIGAGAEGQLTIRRRQRVLPGQHEGTAAQLDERALRCHRDREPDRRTVAAAQDRLQVGRLRNYVLDLDGEGLVVLQPARIGGANRELQRGGGGVIQRHTVRQPDAQPVQHEQPGIGADQRQCGAVAQIGVGHRNAGDLATADRILANYRVGDVAEGQQHRRLVHVVHGKI